MAEHFLIPSLRLDDLNTKGLSHDLELYEEAGERFLRLWIGGSGAGMDVICRLTKAQAEQLAQGASELAVRIGE